MSFSFNLLRNKWVPRDGFYCIYQRPSIFLKVMATPVFSPRAFCFFLFSPDRGPWQSQPALRSWTRGAARCTSGATGAPTWPSPRTRAAGTDPRTRKESIDSVVQWHPFSLVLVAAPLKMVFPKKGSLCSPTAHLSQMAPRPACFDVFVGEASETTAKDVRFAVWRFGKDPFFPG